MPNIELIFDNTKNELHIPLNVLPEDGKPQSHHFKSTQGDNLIELAGRVCYDSCSSTTKTRGSEDYHKHINEVKHGSVQGHLNLTVRVYTPDIYQILRTLVNRPGFYVRSPIFHGDTNFVDITYNVRSINDWFKFTTEPQNPILFWTLVHHAKKLAPLAVNFNADTSTIYQSEVLIPINEREIWLSFYISNVSRGLTHEWVRHGFSTAISQRSTRYVDESEGDWCWHPLILKHREKLPKYLMAKHFNDHNDWYRKLQDTSQDLYKLYVSSLETILSLEGIDKFTARKQARGAARGLLGNALSTELVWSASLWEIKEIIKQRANEGADGEIRLLANQLYEIVAPMFPHYFKGTKNPCKDGVGYSVLFDEGSTL